MPLFWGTPKKHKLRNAKAFQNNIKTFKTNLKGGEER